MFQIIVSHKWTCRKGAVITTHDALPVLLVLFEDCILAL